MQDRATALAFAKSQIDYCLGSTGRSYVVGWGITQALRVCAPGERLCQAHIVVPPVSPPGNVCLSAAPPKLLPASSPPWLQCSAAAQSLATLGRCPHLLPPNTI